MTKFQEENNKLKKNSAKSGPNKSKDVSDSTKKSTQTEKVIEELRRENEDMKKTIELLRTENDILKKSQADTKRIQNESQYYKGLAETKFKECTKLAEEIICLRSDLDRSHSNYLRVQKEKGTIITSIKSEEDLPSTLTTQRRSSLK